MPEKELFGTENLETLLFWTIDTAQEVITGATSDNRLTWSEALGLGDNVLALPTVINSIKHLKDEWDDLSKEETDILSKKIEDRFDIENDKVEKLIEMSIDIVIRNVKYATEVVAMFKK